MKNCELQTQNRLPLVANEGQGGKLGVSLTSAGLSVFAYTAPIGLTIGFIDIAGGFNGFYNYLDNQHEFYKTTGGVMLPINGIPNYLRFKR